MIFFFQLTQIGYHLLLQRPKYFNYWKVNEIIFQAYELTQQNRRSSSFKNSLCSQNNPVKPSVFGVSVW